MYIYFLLRNNRSTRPAFKVNAVVSIILLINVFLWLRPVQAFLKVTAGFCMLKLVLVFNPMGQQAVDCGDLATEILLRSMVYGVAVPRGLITVRRLGDTGQQRA